MTATVLTNIRSHPARRARSCHWTRVGAVVPLLLAACASGGDPGEVSAGVGAALSQPPAQSTFEDFTAEVSSGMGPSVQAIEQHLLQLQSASQALCTAESV